MPFFDVYNITNVVLTIVSVGIMGWMVFLGAKRRNKIRRYHYLVTVAALVVAVLCVRAICQNYKSWNVYDKVLRPTKSYYLDELRLSPRECIADFEEVRRIVNRYYRKMALHKGIDLERLNEEYGEKVKNVGNAQEYGLLLVQYFSDLQNMHSYPYFLQRLGLPSVVCRNDSVWISDCFDESIDLKRKDLIVAVNGMPTADYIKKQMKFVSASTERERQGVAARHVLYSYTDTCKQVTVRRGDSIFMVSVPLYTEKEALEVLERQVVECRRDVDSSERLEKLLSSYVNLFEGVEDVGYIYIPHFEAGSVENFRKWATFEFRNDYLILDLQKNSGGVQGNVMKIASWLIPNAVTMGKVTVESDTSKCFRGKVFVLIDESTASGGEMLAALLKTRPGTVVVGRQSAGDCGSWGYNFKTSHGIEFKLATEVPYLLPDGVTWSEGEGICPDVEVEECLPWENKKEAFRIALDLIKEEKRIQN